MLGFACARSDTLRFAPGPRSGSLAGSVTLERPQLDREPCGRNVQGHEHDRDRAREPVGRGDAGVVQNVGPPCAREPCPLGLDLKLGQLVLGRVEGRELVTHALHALDQFVDLAAVLATQTLELVQPLLGKIELAGADLDLVDQPRRRSGSFFTGDLCGLELLGDLAERGQALGQAPGPVEQHRQLRGDRVVALVQLRLGERREAAELMGATQHAEAPAQLLILAGLGADALELVDLKAQVVGPLQPLGLALADVGDAIGEHPPGAVVAHVVGERPLGAVELGVGVEQVEVMTHIGQRVVLMLTADLEQLAADLGQRSERGEVRLDGHAAATRSPKLTLEHQALVLELEPELGQPRRELLADPATHGELRLDARGLVTFADQLGPTSTAAQQRERVDDDRLAGPGLAGQHVHARFEFEGHVVEECEAADAQVVEHDGLVTQRLATGQRLRALGGITRKHHSGHAHCCDFDVANWHTCIRRSTHM